MTQSICECGPVHCLAPCTHTPLPFLSLFLPSLVSGCLYGFSAQANRPNVAAIAGYVQRDSEAGAISKTSSTTSISHSHTFSKTPIGSAGDR